MAMVRSMLALLGGFLTMAVIVGVITAVLMKRAPEWVGSKGSPGGSYVVVNLIYSLLAAMAGGFVAAWIANRSPMTHILVLAIIVLLLSGLSALQMRGMQPVWYQLSLMVLSPLGIFLGGLIRVKITGA